MGNVNSSHSLALFLHSAQQGVSQPKSVPSVTLENVMVFFFLDRAAEVHSTVAKVR